VSARPSISWVRRHPWWTTAFGIVVFSAVLVRRAGTRPSYDAYGWLVSGYQTLHANVVFARADGAGRIVHL
jgi:hypothetical protein